MNLRQIANAATQTINPNMPVIVKKFAGYSSAAGGKVTSVYEDIFVEAQIQPVDSFKTQHLQGYAQGGVYKAFYLNGDFTGLSRGKGSDLIIAGNETYEVIDQPEGWALTAGWTKVIGCRQ
ncbi:MAG: hypothetical protein LBV16_06325 [Elusimicrobiota bacterium]|jgi:hypothetical protein|nr:hypothetical protein [Elusimicrobiota bacterium]